MIRRFFLLPRIVLQSSGSASAYAVAIAVGASLLGLVLTLRVAGSGALPEPTLAGRLSRGGAGVLLLAFNLLTMTLMLRIFTRLLVTLLYPTTPSLAFVAAFVAAAYLAEIGTAAHIARTVQIILLFSLPAYLLANALLVPRVAYPLDLIPGRFTTDAVLAGAATAFLLFWGYDVVHAIASDLPSKALSPRPVLPIYAGNVLLMVIPFILVIGVFGLSHTLIINWPLADAFRAVTFAGFLLNRVGVLAVASWSVVVAGVLFFRLWVFGRTYALMFGPEEPGWVHRAIPAVVGALSLFPVSREMVEGAVTGLLAPLAWLTAFLVPALLAAPLVRRGGWRRARRSSA